MNRLARVMCFTGGANLEVLRRCATEKNGFAAAGTGVMNVTLISTVTMGLVMNNVLSGRFYLALGIAVFYGFIVFIGYWGMLSAMRRERHPVTVMIFGISALMLAGASAADAIIEYVLKDKESLTSAIIILLVLAIYFIPLIIRLIMRSSVYEEEQARIERNFITQKEADIIAYRDEYRKYAPSFNAVDIKMDLVKRLSETLKAYQEFVEGTRKETFDYLNELAKLDSPESALLVECEDNVKGAFNLTLNTMSKIFSGA